MYKDELRHYAFVTHTTDSRNGFEQIYFILSVLFVSVSVLLSVFNYFDVGIKMSD